MTRKFSVLSVLLVIYLQATKPGACEPKLIMPFDGSSCGIMSKPAGLIQGGQISKRSQFPWIAAIEVLNDGVWSHQGSGSIISKRHVLAPVYVVSYLDTSRKYKAVDAERVRVVVGASLNISTTESLRVAKIANHPFAREVMNSLTINSVTVLTLTLDFTFTDVVRPACLWPFASALADVADKEAYVVGYGRDENEVFSPLRKQIRLKIQKSCEKYFSEEMRFRNETRMFCVRGKGGETPCSGDSQLYVKIGANWFLKGMLATFRIYDDDSCDPNDQIIVEDVEHNVMLIKQLMLL